MQSVNAAFTAEEKDSVRKIAYNLQVAWHRQTTIGNRIFTIGVSTIGGSGVIGINPGAIGSPSIYKYFDESAYLVSLGWDRGYNLPQGGLTMAMAQAKLDNTSGRFLPNYMGGKSELFTAIQPRKPVILNAGFNLSGADITLPQFSGLLNKQPAIDITNKVIGLEATDYMSYFQNKDVGNSPVYTGVKTDVVIKNLLNLQGMSTAQYRLDQGINTIPFAYFDSTSKLSDTINYLVQSENGQFYQDEMGVFRFENRSHYDVAPYTQVQKVITTAQVISAVAPNDDHIINVVEVNINPRVKASSATLYSISTPITLGASGDTTVFVDFLNPVLQISGSSIVANSLSDGSGTNVSANISIKSSSVFSQNAIYVLHNSGTNTAYVTTFTLTGRWAVTQYPTAQTIRVQDNASVTAYQEQVLSISNDYIQDPVWAQSLGQLILNDFAKPDNLQIITIRAIPELQLGDLISWQGRYWRIYNIRATMDVSVGFIQELSLIKKSTPTNYFTIGVSTIGGMASIAP